MARWRARSTPVSPALRSARATCAGYAWAAMLACIAGCARPNRVGAASAHRSDATESLPTSTGAARVTDAATPRATCDPLPAVRPREISLAVERSVLPFSAEPARHERGEVTDARAHCAGDPALCRVLPAATLDAVYARLQRAHPERFTGTAASGSPHSGTLAVVVTWPGGRCSVGTSSQWALDPANDSAFNDVFAAVLEAYGQGE